MLGVSPYAIPTSATLRTATMTVVGVENEGARAMCKSTPEALRLNWPAPTVAARRDAGRTRARRL